MKRFTVTLSFYTEAEAEKVCRQLTARYPKSHVDLNELKRRHYDKNWHKQQEEEQQEEA